MAWAHCILDRRSMPSRPGIIRLHGPSCPRSSPCPLCPLCHVCTRGWGEDWPQFRGPTGQGHHPSTGFRWSGARRRTSCGSAAARKRLVVAGDRGGRVWLTTATERDGRSLRALAYDARPGRELVNIEVFRARGDARVSVRRICAPRRHRSSRATGSTSTSARREPLPSRRTARFLDNPVPVQSQHGSGGSPLSPAIADLLRRRARGGVRRGARQGDRQRQAEDEPPATRSIRPIRRRSSSASAIAISSSASAHTGRGPRSADRRGNLARSSIRRVFERAAAGLRPRARLHRDRIPQADAHGGPAPTARASDETHVAWTQTRSAPLTPSPLARRRRAVHGQRRRDRDLHGREDRRHALA